MVRKELPDISFVPQVAALQGQVTNLQTRATVLQRTTNQATNAGTTEVDAVADYVLTSGTKCGPQTITGK